jgi:hypothetical protein
MRSYRSLEKVSPAAEIFCKNMKYSGWFLPNLNSSCRVAAAKEISRFIW